MFKASRINARLAAHPPGALDSRGDAVGEPILGPYVRALAAYLAISDKHKVASEGEISHKKTKQTSTAQGMPHAFQCPILLSVRGLTQFRDFPLARLYRQGIPKILTNAGLLFVLLLILYPDLDYK